MYRIDRLLRIVFLGLILSGCSMAIKPEVDSLDLEELEASLINNLVLTKRVNLERGIRKGGIYSHEKTTDVTATSNFGKEHEIANVECIIAGLSGVFGESSIITNAQFWESIGEGIETLNLALLFDEQYSYALKSLELDYLVVADHQRIDVESSFYERITDGAFIDEDKEAAATVTIDIKNKRVLHATEIDAGHSKAVGHLLFYIPVALHTYPDEDPCNMAGRLAADAITQSITFNKTPRIAVVAAGHWKATKEAYLSKISQWKATKEAYLSKVLQKQVALDRQQRIQIRLKTFLDKASQGNPDAQYNVFLIMKDEYTEPAVAWEWLCKAADQGYKKAQEEVGYWHNKTNWERTRPLFERLWLRKAGIHADNRVAYMWYNIAANGDPDRLRTISDLFSGKLTEEEIAEADDMIRNWKPGQCPTPYQ